MEPVTAGQVAAPYWLEPNLHSQAGINVSTGTTALDSRPSPGSSDRGLGAGRTGVWMCGGLHDRLEETCPAPSTPAPFSQGSSRAMPVSPGPALWGPGLGLEQVLFLGPRAIPGHPGSVGWAYRSNSGSLPLFLYLPLDLPIHEAPTMCGH